MHLSWLLPFAVFYFNLMFVVKILAGQLAGPELILGYVFTATSLANMFFVLRFAVSSLIENIFKPELAECIFEHLSLILMIVNSTGLILIVLGFMPIGTASLRSSSLRPYNVFGFFSFILNTGFLAYLVSVFYICRCRRTT